MPAGAISVVVVVVVSVVVVVVVVVDGGRLPSWCHCLLSAAVQGLVVVVLVVLHMLR